jgi:hypothetical protein
MLSTSMTPSNGISSSSLENDEKEAMLAASLLDLDCPQFDTSIFLSSLLILSKAFHLELVLKYF